LSRDLDATEIPLVHLANHREARCVSGRPSLDPLRGLVGAPLVDHDHLEVAAVVLGGGGGQCGFDLVRGLKVGITMLTLRMLYSWET
jgi:hypothetical protein